MSVKSVLSKLVSMWKVRKNKWNRFEKITTSKQTNRCITHTVYTCVTVSALNFRHLSHCDKVTVFTWIFLPPRAFPQKYPTLPWRLILASLSFQTPDSFKQSYLCCWCCWLTSCLCSGPWVNLQVTNHKHSHTQTNNSLHCCLISITCCQ